MAFHHTWLHAIASKQNGLCDRHLVRLLVTGRFGIIFWLREDVGSLAGSFFVPGLRAELAVEPYAWEHSTNVEHFLNISYLGQPLPTKHAVRFGLR